MCFEFPSVANGSLDPLLMIISINHTHSKWTASSMYSQCHTVFAFSPIMFYLSKNYLSHKADVRFLSSVCLDLIRDMMWVKAF